MATATFPAQSLDAILAVLQGREGACVYAAINGGLDLLKFVVSVIDDCEEDHPEPRPLGDCPDCPTDEDKCNKLLELKAACSPEGEGMQAIRLPSWAASLLMDIINDLLVRWTKR